MGCQGSRLLTNYSAQFVRETHSANRGCGPSACSGPNRVQSPVWARAPYRSREGDGVTSPLMSSLLGAAGHT